MQKSAGLSITSDDVNYLIYRYLQESGILPLCGRELAECQACFHDCYDLTHLSLFTGFHHAAFTFAHESQVHRINIEPDKVPAGTLITFIQKGMQYMELEANLEVGLCHFSNIWHLWSCAPPCRSTSVRSLEIHPNCMLRV